LVATYGCRFSAREQEVEAFAGKTVHGLFGLGQGLGLHQIRKDPAVLGVVERGLDVCWDGDVHDIHDSLDVLAHVVGQQRQDLGGFTAQRVVSHHVGAAEERLDPSGEVVLPSLLRDEAHGLAKGIL
jgi:hypothetical protein